MNTKPSILIRSKVAPNDQHDDPSSTDDKSSTQILSQNNYFEFAQDYQVTFHVADEAGTAPKPVLSDATQSDDGLEDDAPSVVCFHQPRLFLDIEDSSSDDSSFVVIDGISADSGSSSCDFDRERSSSERCDKTGSSAPRGVAMQRTKFKKPLFHPYTKMVLKKK